MTTKRYLSEKKTAQQSISLSPALKDWIERYVNINRKKNPKDVRFKSISAFYNYIMEKSLNILSMGKSLDDFQRFVDGRTKDFFDKVTFRAVIPFHEELVRTHRYTNLTFAQITSFLFAIRKLYLNGIEPYNYSKIQERFEILRNFYLENKIAKEIRLELFTEGNTRYPKGIFECVGNYKNLFWENCKINAAVLGIIGAKITDIIYSDKDLYCRFNLIATELVFRKELIKKERIKLVNENVDKLLNYKEMIFDKDFYLWMKLAEDKEISVNFNNEKIKNKWLNLVVSDIQEFSEPDEIPLAILKFFEKIHWIDIENETEKSFKIRLIEEKSNDQIQFLIEILSKYSNIKHLNGKYYLE